jgi:hypothetical protein
MKGSPGVAANNMKATPGMPASTGMHQHQESFVAAAKTTIATMINQATAGTSVICKFTIGQDFADFFDT